MDVLEFISCETEKYYKLGPGTIHLKTRKREVVQARQMAMKFSRIYTKNSTGSIGRAIGKKDHATVLHALKTMANLIDTDPLVRSDFNELDKIFKSYFTFPEISKEEYKDAIFEAILKLLKIKLTEMETLQRKMLTQEFNRCLAFIETSIKIIGPSFSLDKSFSEFRQLQTGEKFSPEAVVSLDKAMERAKEVFSLMEQDINEVVETLKSKWITKLN